jgi:hypothetical protein
MSAEKTQDRGSSKLAAMSHEDLAQSIKLARASYKIERWWKYGQPAIDRIQATLNISKVEEAATVISDLIRRHGSEVQVTLEVFPYGVPVFDGVNIHVNLEQQVH